MPCCIDGRLAFEHTDIAHQVNITAPLLESCSQLQGSDLELTSMKSVVFKLFFSYYICGWLACISASAHMHACAHTLIFSTCFGELLSKLVLQGFPLMRGVVPLLYPLDIIFQGSRAEDKSLFVGLFSLLLPQEARKTRPMCCQGPQNCNISFHSGFPRIAFSDGRFVPLL